MPESTLCHISRGVILGSDRSTFAFNENQVALDRSHFSLKRHETVHFTDACFGSHFDPAVTWALDEASFNALASALRRELTQMKGETL